MHNEGFFSRIYAYNFRILVKFLDRKFIAYTIDQNGNMKLSLKPIRKILYEEFQNNLTKEAEMINDVQKSNALKNIYQRAKT